VTEAAAIPEELARAAGMSETDIDAMNFALMMTGIGEVNALPGLASGLTKAKNVATTVTEIEKAATTATEAKDVVTTVIEAKNAVTTAAEIEKSATAVTEAKNTATTAAEIKNGTTAATEAKNATTTAAEIKNAAAAANPGGESIHQLLVRSEAAGGHLVEKHIGEVTADLASRLAREPRIPDASTFNSFAEAETAVEAAFKANAGSISQWISGGARGRLTLNAPFTGGSVLTRGAATTTTGTGVRVILKGTGGGAWQILTGYPTR
jgi:hypothetical protein